MYYIYMLRCKDNSIYTGITSDINRRMNEHFHKTKKCAKYTYNHSATKLENVWSTETRALASTLEYHIKKLSKIEKENLIKDENIFKKVLPNKINYQSYNKIDIHSIHKK